MRSVACRVVTLVSGIRVEVERKDDGTSSIFEVTPIVAGKPGRGRSLGPMNAADLRSSAAACGMDDERYIAHVAVEEMLQEVERDGADQATICVAATALWRRTLGPKILAMKAASLLCALLLASCVVVGFDSPDEKPAAVPVPVDLIPEEDHHAWFLSPRLDTTERQAARFLLAQIQRRDDAVCKAVIWCASSPRHENSPTSRINVSIQAAINLLRDRDWSEVVELVERDAHFFGVADPDVLLARVKGVIER